MSNTVDNRVVEMQFKNEEFERGIKQTVTSLNDLKEALKINTKSLDLSRVQREADGLNLANITKNIEVLTDRFSTLGIVGMTVIQRLTNGAINLVERLGQITFGQIISGGKGRAQKVADARFKLEGLLNTAEDVEAAFTAAGNAVDGTAYGMDAAVSTASQLVSSGVELGKEGEHMEKVLKGVAGLAAMTNTDFDYMGNIFATVAGNGRLMGMQLSQISAHGVNAAATLAKAMGKTEEEIRSMVSKGQISFEQFSDAMTDAFGEQAAKADKTLTGVLTNIRAQLSRIGEIFAGGIIENDTLIEFLGNIKKVIRSIVVTLKPLAEPFKRIVTSVATLGNSLLKLFFNIEDQKFLKGDVLVGIVDKIASAFNAVSDFIDSLTAKVNNFAEKSGIKKVTEEVKDGVKNIREATDTIRGLADEIWFGGKDHKNSYGNGQKRKDMLGDMYQDVQDYVNAMKAANFDKAKADEIYANTAVKETEKVIDAKEKERQARENAIKKAGERSEEVQKSQTVSKILGGIAKIFSNIAKTATAVGKAFKTVFTFKGFKEGVMKIVTAFGNLLTAFEMTDERAGKVQTGFEGLFSIFKIVGDVIVNLVSGGLNLLAKVLPTILDTLLKVFNTVGNLVKRFREFIESNNLLVRAGRFIVTTFTKIVEVMKEFFTRLMQLPAVQKLKEELKDIYEVVGAKFIEWIGLAKDAMGDFFNAFSSEDETAMDRILGGINTALETTMSLAGKGKDNITKFFDKFKKGGELEKTVIYLEDIGDGYEKVEATSKALVGSKGPVDFLNNLRKASGGAGSKAEEHLGKITNAIKNLDVAKLTLIGIAGALTAFTISFTYLTVNISDSIKTFAEFPRQVVGVLKTIRGTFDEVGQYFRRKSVAKIVTQVAIAIGVAAASIAALGYVTSKVGAANILTAAYAISMILGLMTVMVTVLADLTKSQKSAKKFNDMMEAFSKIILSMSASVFLLAAAMYAMSNIKWNRDAFISFGALVAIMAGLIGVIAIINKLGPEIKSSGIWLIFYAGSVFLLVKSLNSLANLEVEKIKSKLLVLIEAMTMVAIVAAASSRMSFGGGVGVLALIGSIILMELALKWVIAYGVTSKDIKPAEDALITALAGLVLIGVYLAVLSRVTKDPKGMGFAIVSLVLALIVISNVLKKLTSLPLGKLIVATGALAVLLLEMMALIYISGQVAQANRIKQAGNMLLKVAGALVILGIVIAFLGSIPRDVLYEGGAAVAMITLLMIALIGATHFAGKVDPKGLIAMMGVMTTMAVLVSLMSFIEDKAALFQSVMMLCLLLVAFGGSMALATMYAKKTSSGPISRMAETLVLVGGILLGLTYLNKGDYMTMLAAAASLSLVFLAVGRCAQMMMESFTKNGVGVTKLTQVLKIIRWFTALVAVVGLMLTGITFIAGDNVATVAVAALAISVVLAAMAGVVWFIAKKLPSGKAVDTTKKKLENMLLLSAVLVVIAASMSALTYFAKSEEAILSAALSMSLVLAALSGVYWALNDVKASKDIVARAASLVVVSAALIPIAFSLAMLGDIDWDKLKNAVFALVVVISVITVALLALTEISKSGTGFAVVMAVAAAIAGVALALAYGSKLIAGAIKTVVNAINLLSKINYKAIDTKKLGELVMLLFHCSQVAIVTAIAIGALGLSLITLGVGITAVSIPLIPLLLSIAELIHLVNKFTKMLIDNSISAKKIAAGIDTVSNSMDNAIINAGKAFALGIVIFIKTLEMNAKAVGTALKNFIITVIDVVFTARIEITRKLIEGLTELFTMLEETLPSLFEHFNNTLLILLAQIAENAIVYGYFGAVIAGYFVAGILYGLADAAYPLVDSALALGISLCDAMFTAVENYKPNIGGLFKKTGLTLLKGIYDVVGTSVEIVNYDLGQQIKGYSDEMDDEINAINGEISQANYERAKERAHKTIDGFEDGAKEGTDSMDLTGIGNSVGLKTDDALDHSDSAKNIGFSTIAGYADSLTNGDFDLSSLKDFAASEVADKLGTGSSEGIQVATSQLEKDINGMPEEAIKGYQSQGWKKVGDKLVKDVYETVDESTSGAEGNNVLNKIGSWLGLDGEGGVMDKFTSFSEGTGEKGTSAINKWFEGMHTSFTDATNLNQLDTDVLNVADHIDTTFTSPDGIDVNSPSKKAIKYGNSWMEGLLIPFNNSNDKIDRSMINVANTIGSSFNSQIQNGSNNLEFTPTVRPVLDSSNMGQYGGLMNILDNPTTVKLAADSQLSIDNANQFRLGQQIDALRADINKMANTDFSKIMDGVTIDVSADTTVDGTVLRKTASSYTIGQINKKQQGYIMATGGRF